MKDLVLGVLLLAIFLPSCELVHEDDSMADIISKQKMLDLVNDLRAEGCDCGGTYMPSVGKLEWDYQLERAATAHSIDMNVNSYFDHVSIDGSSYADRINGTDYEGRPQGENIASGYQNEEAVFNGWKNSPGHCRNMMGSGHTDIAIGRSGNYWTMVFGRK